MKKILYVRGGPYQLDPNSYNLQEIGLARALYDFGYECDVMYYHKKKNYDEEIEKDGKKIKILWRKGIRLFRTGIYPQILKKDFLNKYDIVISSEYSQLMSVLLCKRCNNTYIYNGPYYNLFKIPFMEKVYDKLFCRIINKKAKKIFCKTKMAENYINKKGLINTSVIGVGLDTSKFDVENNVEKDTQKLLDKMNNQKNILYVGQIVKRKNIEFIIKSFLRFKKIDSNSENVNLILVGKGDEDYQKYCKSLIPYELEKNIIWCSFISNSQMKYIYEKADLFILPSIYEIFGMVLLEAMYYGIPVISSNSAGADTLIVQEENGVIIKEFDELKWAEKIKNIIENDKLSKKLGNNARNRIINDFNWKSIAEKIINQINENNN